MVGTFETPKRIMRLKSLHLREVGPLKHYDLDLQDKWRNEVQTMTLLSGTNGCGKSTILRAVSYLWQATGLWLALPRKRITDKNAVRTWLNRWKSCAMVLEGVEQAGGAVGIFFGEAGDFDGIRHLAKHWIGECRMGGRQSTELLHNRESYLMEWSESYKRLVLSADHAAAANMIHLDGEERRWVKPSIKLGEVVADDPSKRWLVNYAPTAHWKGQIEASLVAMKTVYPELYEIVLRELNGFLAPKSIIPTPDQNLRLRIQSPEGREHSVDDLSAGERQILIQLFLVARSLSAGGIVMIDEPDLHLHPSLLSLYLSRLELLVQKRNGQLILTSHNPELWSRYEARGHRVQLGGGQ